MLTSMAAAPLSCKSLMRIACCLSIFSCSSVIGQEDRSSPRASGAVEQEALKVLNDSDWAHTIKPSLQATACTYQNPAFPGLYPEDKATLLDARAPSALPDTVKPDDSEYLIRFQSAKPVQTAIQQLVASGEKWSDYAAEKFEHGPNDRPTDVANAWYNVMDMVTVTIILKHLGSTGTSLFDYGYSDNAAPGLSVWPCAGLRTNNGQVFAHAAMGTYGYEGKYKALQLSFPRLIEPMLLISEAQQKVEFRLVSHQRVFETSFLINASDVPDGTEKSLYLPSAFTDLKGTDSTIVGRNGEAKDR
jgi:hypothetical protein